MLEALWPIPCAGCSAPRGGRLCDSCRPERALPIDPPALVSEAWAASGYNTPLGAALLRAKGQGDRGLAVALASAAAEVLLQEFPHVDAIVPVPSPWTRRMARGFAMSSVLAAELSRHTGIEAHHRALTISPGPRQAALSDRQRARALAGRVRSRRSVRGTVLLVDDVCTTGATASACARELLGTETSHVLLAVICATAEE